MDIILLERVEKLGGIGDVVAVKNGFARNYLIPQGKALLASDKNKKAFEAQRAEIEARNEKAREAAQTESQSLDGSVYVLIRQSSELGQLYGSVAARDVAEAAKAEGHPVEKRQVLLDQPIKTLGVHQVTIRLHPEVSVDISVNVARSEDEAERQAAGENVIETALAEERAQADEQAAELAEAAAEAQEQRAPEGDE